MNQTVSLRQLSWRAIVRLALAVLTTRRWLTLFYISLVTLAASVSGTFAQRTSNALLATGTLLVMLLALRFISLVKYMRRRLTHLHTTGFGKVAFFDGVEECIAPQELEEYACILRRLEQELGIPVKRHTLCIYPLAETLPFEVVSALFRCSFVRYIVSVQAEFVAFDVFLQQSVALYLYMNRRDVYHLFGRLPNLTGCYRLGRAIVWSSFPERYAHRFSTVAAYRSLGRDTRAISLVRGADSKEVLAADLLLAFIAEQRGLRTMFESYAKARRHERISLSYMASLFGSVVELERQWGERLKEARASDSAPDVTDVICLASELKEAGFPVEAFQAVKKTLAHNPHSGELLVSALKHAAELRDVRECLPLVTTLIPLVQLRCIRARLQLAEGLLHHIAGDENRSRECFHGVAELPVHHARVLAQRWLADAPSIDWAWVEVQRLVGVML